MRQALRPAKIAGLPEDYVRLGGRSADVKVSIEFLSVSFPVSVCWKSPRSFRLGQGRYRLRPGGRSWCIQRGAGLNRQV